MKPLEIKLGQKVRINSPGSPVNGMCGKVKCVSAHNAEVQLAAPVGGDSVWCIALERLEAAPDEPEQEVKHSQYKKRVRLPLIKPIGDTTHVEVLLDIYDVLNAYKTGNPAVDHAVKKELRLGTDHNDRITDLRESMDSLQRAIELEEGR